MSDLKGTDIKGIDFKGTDLKGMDIKGTVPPAAKRLAAGGTVPVLNLWVVKGTVPLTTPPDNSAFICCICLCAFVFFRFCVRRGSPAWDGLPCATLRIQR